MKNKNAILLYLIFLYIYKWLYVPNISNSFNSAEDESDKNVDKIFIARSFSFHKPKKYKHFNFYLLINVTAKFYANIIEIFI